MHAVVVVVVDVVVIVVDVVDVNIRCFYSTKERLHIGQTPF